ncbi:MAG TPA: amidohydrolase [Candidatus Heimdallarchaeota archaeon]|nr:amidohydrolase [Candidatus Heimdallarchaeota archaeon]
MRKSSKAGLCVYFVLICAVCFFSLTACTQKPEPADLVLLNGDIWTVEEANPTAKALVVSGNKITAVCQSDTEAKRYIGDETKVIDLEGQFVTPGIIDGHVHFNAAGGLILDANLMMVSDEEGLREEIGRVVGILDDGEWISRGLWGAYEQWALGDAGEKGSEKAEPWRPNRSMIDDLTPNNPCFLCRFDYKEWLANTAALKAADLETGKVKGMVLGKAGNPTGVILNPSPAFDKMRDSVKPKSHNRMLNENRAALKALRESGIVEIHDIARPDQTERFVELQDNGELTCRVWLRPDLARGAELKEQGLTMGLHPKTKEKSSWLRYGALKGYIDGIMGTHGALFYEPYNDQPDNYGHWRRHTSDDPPEYKTRNMEKMYNLIKVGIEGGFVPNVHAIGTRGVAEMLDLYERLQNEGVDLAGFRVIHAQVIRSQDFPRFKALGVIAEINPYHISDDMRWMEERIGHERCKGAYAFKSLLDNGAMLSFGSDWPGTSAALYHMHPKYLIYAAVARKTLKGTPEEGWFPEQKISVEESIKAFTINNAFAAFEGDIRGSIVEGKLADFTVFNKNLIEIPEADILKTEVTHTIVDGKVVFER